MTKQKAIAKKPPEGGPVVTVHQKEGETPSQSGARAIMDPTVMGGVLALDIITEGKPSGATESHDLINELRDQFNQISANDFTSAERMLFAQAHTLNQLFTTMTLNGLANRRGGNTASYEMHLRLALKAQSQCRTTLESLSEIKNPKAVAFIRQANVATNQQVNNGRAEETTTSQPNELLGVVHEQPLDTRGPGNAGKRYSTVETVGAVNGTTHRGRKSASE